jgi:bacillithiol synthase
LRSVDVNLKSSNSFANDYLYDFDKLKALFAYDPYASQSCTERYEYLSSKPHPSRATVVKVLTEYNRELGAGQETLDNIALLAQAETAVVVTGQQAGLLGGPLFTIYKALTAIQLAKKYSRQLNRPVIPVFWVASEDHDFGEINHFHILDRQGKPARIRLETEPKGKFSIGDIAVPPEAEAVIAQLADSSIDTEFKPDLLDFLGKSARESENLADWFGRILLKWLGSTGLVMLNPMDPSLRNLEADLFRQALDNAPQVNTLLSKAGAELSSKGYPVGVEKDQDNLNLFMYHNGERLALIKTGTGYGLKGTEESFSRDSLLELMEAEPERFSPNVILRPLTQELLLPTLAYVGGPGEINYFSQYKEIFELFKLQMPIIYPRANITLIEGSMENYLNKYNLTLEDVLFNLDEIRQQLLVASDPVGIDNVFQELHQRVAEAYSRAIGVIKEIDPMLDKLGRENQERVLSQIDWLKSKTQQAHRKDNDVALRQLEKLSNNLSPSGNLQERFLSGMYFAIKYGCGFFNSLNEMDLVGNVAHKMLFLKN